MEKVSEKNAARKNQTPATISNSHAHVRFLNSRTRIERTLLLFVYAKRNPQRSLLGQVNHQYASKSESLERGLIDVASVQCAGIIQNVLTLAKNAFAEHIIQNQLFFFPFVLSVFMPS